MNAPPFANQSGWQPGLIVCGDCDLLCEQPSAPSRHQIFRCPRCTGVLHKTPWGRLDTALALVFTAAVLLLILNTNPLLSMRFQGIRKDTTLVGAVIDMWSHDVPLISALVFGTTILAPSLQICIQFRLIYAIRVNHTWTSLGKPLRAVLELRPWSMVEILMLAILVSLVKLQGVAEIILGPALWSCAALVLVMSALTSLLSSQSVWHWMNRGGL